MRQFINEHTVANTVRMGGRGPVFIAVDQAEAEEARRVVGLSNFRVVIAHTKHTALAAALLVAQTGTEVTAFVPPAGSHYAAPHRAPNPKLRAALEAARASKPATRPRAARDYLAEARGGGMYGYGN